MESGATSFIYLKGMNSAFTEQFPLSAHKKQNFKIINRHTQWVYMILLASSFKLDATPVGNSKGTIASFSL